MRYLKYPVVAMELVFFSTGNAVKSHDLTPAIFTEITDFKVSRRIN